MITEQTIDDLRNRIDDLEAALVVLLEALRISEELRRAEPTEDLSKIEREHQAAGRVYELLRHAQTLTQR